MGCTVTAGGVKDRRDGMLEPEIEAKSWERVQSDAFRSLQKQVSRLYEVSPYYRGKFNAANFHPRQLKDIEDAARIPFFTKDEERISQETAPPYGEHLSVDPTQIVRVQASSGTTGVPTFFALTRNDLATWDRIMARDYFTMGLRPNDVYAALSNLSMFAGGVPSLTAAAQVGANVIPIGTGVGTDRALDLARRLGATVIGLTPSYALYLGETMASNPGRTAANLNLTRLLVGGEPGAQIPGIRRQIEEMWQCPVRDVMGIGEMVGAFWAESDDEAGMHFCAQREIFVELIDPDSGELLDLIDGASGELVYTAIERDATPLIRFRSSDMVEVMMGEVPSGRTSPRIKVLGRTDDMLIVRGVNVFPSAIRDVIASHTPQTTGHLRVVMPGQGPLAPSPLPIMVEVLETDPHKLLVLHDRLADELRSKLMFSPQLHFIPAGKLSRTELKTALVVRQILTEALQENAASPLVTRQEGMQ